MITAGLHQIVLDSVAPQPWRNGGGVTRELFAWPDAADWWLRISLADVAADGPFSAFPGIERWFAVLDGDGVVLHRGTQRVALGADDAPWRFDGGEPPDCTLQGGPTRDLNLMLRRSAGQGAMSIARPGDEWLAAAPWRAVFTTAAATLQIDDCDAARLPPSSLLLSRHGAHQRWRLLADAEPPRALWIEFTPRPT